MTPEPSRSRDGAEIFVCGTGAVSPAGWGVPALQAALARGEPLPSKEIVPPGSLHRMQARAVPSPVPRPSYINHARLRRTSPIAQHAVAAAIEAIGDGDPAGGNGSHPVGVIVCVMSGCVNYSRRFYDEALNNPATASPLVFPETVFNAPASHIGALLGTTSLNYTLVGDAGTFLQGLALAADWLIHRQVDGCLVVGAEELDWLTTEAYWLFDQQTVVSSGAGALYLRTEPKQSLAVRLEAVTDSYPFARHRSRAEAAQAARMELGNGERNVLLCDGLQGTERMDRDEELAWRGWKGARLSPKRILGEGSVAAAAWQCIAAVDAIQRGAYPAATVSVVGSNQQAIAGRFVRADRGT